MTPEIAAAPAQPVEQPIAPAAPIETPAAPSVEQDFRAFEAEENAKALGKPAPVAPPAPIAEPAAAVPAADDTAPKGLEQFVKTPPPPGVSKRQHAINEAIRHATALEQEVARLKSGTPPANQPPAQPATPPQPPKDYDGIDPSDPEPQIDQFADAIDPYAAHLRAQIRWEDRKDARVAQHKAQQTARQTESQARMRDWAGRRDAFAATSPEFVAKAGALLTQLQPDTPIGDTIMDSPIGPQLALHLAEHPEEFQRIYGLHWKAQLRELGKLEASLSTAPAAPAPPAAPQPKLVTSAPTPPPTLGTRSAEPADPVAAAVARKDFSAFEQNEIAVDLARKGRR